MFIPPYCLHRRNFQTRAPVQVGSSISLASFSLTRTESRVPCPVTTQAVSLPSGDNTKGNTDDTSTNKAPWYSDFVEGGELAKNIARDAYDAVTWKSIWRFTMDRLPFLEWMQTYTLVRFIKDAQAGLVVATLVIPQVRNKEPCKDHDGRNVRVFRRNTDHVSLLFVLSGRV